MVHFCITCSVKEHNKAQVSQILSPVKSGVPKWCMGSDGEVSCSLRSGWLKRGRTISLYGSRCRMDMSMDTSGGLFSVEFVRVARAPCSSAGSAVQLGGASASVLCHDLLVCSISAHCRLTGLSAIIQLIENQSLVCLAVKSVFTKS